MVPAEVAMALTVSQLTLYNHNSATASATDSRFGSFCSLLNGVSFKLWHVSVANVQASLHRF